MQFGTKVPGTPCGTPGCRRENIDSQISGLNESDQMNQTFLPTHETAPLFLCKHVILATHSLLVNDPCQNFKTDCASSVLLISIYCRVPASD